MLLPYEVEHEDDPRQAQPWFVYGLMAALLVVHLYLYLQVNAAQREAIWYHFGAQRFHFQWWSPLTAVFLHGGLLHLLGNMYFLWIYGGALERRLGWWRIAVIAVLGAFGSLLIHVATVPVYEIDEPAIGASGLISALLGAFLVLMPRAKLSCIFFSVLSFRPTHVVAPAWLVLGLWFLSQLLYTLQLLGHVPGIAFWAHIGGFVLGAAIGTLLQSHQGRTREQWLLSLRQPYVEAWDRFLRSDPTASRRRLDDLHDERPPDDGGGATLLDGLLATHLPDDDAPALPRLFRAFLQARDYGDSPKAVTAYIQILKLAPAALVPAEIHRSAAFAAHGLKLPRLALFAFHQALRLEPGVRHEQTLRALAAIYRSQPDLAEHVPTIQAMLPQYEV